MLSFSLLRPVVKPELQVKAVAASPASALVMA
jgi:hypothetical protein